jgi:Flp pilus assembly protein CpaB
VAGDRVDLIAVLEGADDSLTNAQTILQDVEVLAVAQSTQKPVARYDKDGNPIQTDSAGGSLSTRPDDTGANEDANSITLAVAPEDAPLVVLAQSEGTIWVVLRGQGDEEILPLGPTTLGD